MQASGPGPTALDSRYLKTGQAQAHPAADSFQTMLQRRMVSQKYSKASTNQPSTSQQTTSSRLRQNFPSSKGERLKKDKQPEVVSAKGSGGSLEKAAGSTPAGGAGKGNRGKT